MNVLVINGSPKGAKSNTMQLVREFLDGAGWENAEIVNSISADVKPCRGCFACWNKTPGSCVIKDDMSSILEKIIVADVIIWAFPLYYFSVPGSLKNIIDRQLPLNLPEMGQGDASGSHPLRYDFSNQRYAVISTCGLWTAKGNYDSINAMFGRIYGKGGFSSIFCGQGELFRADELKGATEPYLELVKRAGFEFALGAISPATVKSLTEPLLPQAAFEGMADASWDIPGKGTAREAEGGGSLAFTKQMAALYKPDGASRVLEMHYSDIGKTYQILLSPDSSRVIEEGFIPYTTKIETPYTVWRSIARGEISGQDALFQRKYKVAGDFSLMLKWDDLFSAQPTARSAPAVKEKKANFAVLITPWIFIWIMLSINPMLGGALGIIAASAIPFAWIFYKQVIYEQFSIPAVAICSLAALIGVQAHIAISFSLVLFGFIWLVGSFGDPPITAFYSSKAFGGSHAFANPLFIKTNRILSASWGFLFIFESIIAYWLIGANYILLAQLINNGSVIAMGAFTFWFQKWYPAHWAKMA